MTPTAQRDSKFIADFHSGGSRLRETQVMRVAWLTATDQAGLSSHEFQVFLVA